MLSTEVNNSIISPDLSCDNSHAKKYDATLNVHNYKEIHNNQIVNHESKSGSMNNIRDNNNVPLFHLKSSDNSRNNDLYYNNNLTDHNNPTEFNQYKTNVCNHKDSNYNQLKYKYPDHFTYNNKENLKESETSTLYRKHEEYQLPQNMNSGFLSHKCNSMIRHEQGNDISYEERTKYNKKKSSFNENIINNNYPNHQYDYKDNDNNKNIDNKNLDIIHDSNIDNKHYSSDNYNINNNNTNININNYKNNEVSSSNNINDVYYKNINDSYQNANDKQSNYERNISNLNNGKSVNSIVHINLMEKNIPYKNDVVGDFQKSNINYDKDKKSLNGFTRDELYGSASINRERNMNHTKIFDYVESDNDKKHKQKNMINTFVPKYKNLSAKEVHYNSLSGNDNITVLAANQIKIDLNRLSEKSKDILPNVYPFNLSSDFKNDKKNENKAQLEKLYPTNYNYINNYNKNNSDISLEQRRYNMNSSRIFDCDYDTKEGNSEKFKSETNISYKHKGDIEKVDIEKEEKRKLNPMYSDLFGRKTPDINQNANYEKIMPATMKNNWIYDARNTKKYSELYFKSSDNLEYNGTEKFHRKSYFDKDGYDNKKRLQDAIQKGSKISLQAHLQSTLQCENNYNPSDYNNVEAYYLSLHNIRDSITDEEVKKVIKNSNAHIVSYESEYDLLSNKRKNNAKLCIRHNKGKHGLILLMNLLSQLDIKVTVL
ncbi:conserved Plasmodium protein, unknown function [Plasmodium gallinaceum]|uniref:Uncharacterized protein n=1 Tax=Plasmodium gallinaceum TaxID=5849 RepID=A0A1J1GLB2_PLAGA|nr:conserved Plasmodium protein, unknown function [Plasmodium gallinaceum]CRG92989.1 conserved Plasmodium protein, unknown function [Plasmodium gallinaceum]